MSHWYKPHIEQPVQPRLRHEAISSRWRAFLDALKSRSRASNGAFLGRRRRLASIEAEPVIDRHVEPLGLALRRGGGDLVVHVGREQQSVARVHLRHAEGTGRRAGSERRVHGWQ